MVYEKNGYQLGIRVFKRYWFWKKLPEGVEAVEQIPPGYEVVEGPNHYPFLKYKK